MKIFGILLAYFSALLLSLVAGCVVNQSYPNAISVTTRGLGVRVVTSNPSGGAVTPEIELGWFANHVQITPMSTNPMYAPKTASTFDMGQSINPFATTINSADTTGDLEVFDGTNTLILPRP